MPLITNNLVVGGTPATTPPKKEVTEVRQQKEVSFAEVKRQALEQIPKEPEPVQEKYLVHEHGELVRHINMKSHYMRDIFEDF